MTCPRRAWSTHKVSTYQSLAFNIQKPLPLIIITLISHGAVLTNGNSNQDMSRGRVGGNEVLCNLRLQVHAASLKKKNISLNMDHCETASQSHIKRVLHAGRLTQPQDAINF